MTARLKAIIRAAGRPARHVGDDQSKRVARGGEVIDVVEVAAHHLAARYATAISQPPAPEDRPV
jgi:hypothetical protein